MHVTLHIARIRFFYIVNVRLHTFVSFFPFFFPCLKTCKNNSNSSSSNNNGAYVKDKMLKEKSGWVWKWAHEESTAKNWVIACMHVLDSIHIIDVGACIVYSLRTKILHTSTITHTVCCLYTSFECTVHRGMKWLWIILSS